MCCFFFRNRALVQPIHALNSRQAIFRANARETFNKLENDSVSLIHFVLKIAQYQKILSGQLCDYFLTKCLSIVSSLKMV